MTATYRVEVSGPEPRSADELALMLTSDDHYRTSDYVITVERENEVVSPGPIDRGPCRINITGVHKGKP